MAKSMLHDVMVPKPYQQHLLRDTVYSADSPGPVLHDFQTLLDFIGTEGVETSGQYHLLPIKLLPTLNLHMHFKLEVDLDRGQLRSYLNLQALYLLGRATGVIVPAAINKKVGLVVEAEALRSWQSLTPTEQYFSLLDAWLKRSTREIIGERDGIFSDNIDGVFRVWEEIGHSGQRFSVNDRTSQNNRFAYGAIGHSLAMMILFGVVDIEQGPPIKGRPWIPSVMRQSQFGAAVLAVLQPMMASRFDFDFLDSILSLKPRKQKSDGTATDDFDSPRAVCFNDLQKDFAPYVPAWKNSLSIGLDGFRDGLFTFRVSIGKVWRKIAIPARSTLQELALAILDAMEFSYDHLWEFSFKDRFGGRVEIQHPEAAESANDPTTDEFCVGDTCLRVGQTMEFHYDFGDDWRFRVLLERIDPPTRAKKAKLIESHGKAPQQYHWDEDNDEDYED